MHEGIDIGAAYGTPIRAAASGTVIYCGWESGYGNLVVIDHGGGIATAYGHQSSIAVSCGQQVSQGQVIGYVGCTGHRPARTCTSRCASTASPVDPLGLSVVRRAHEAERLRQQEHVQADDHRRDDRSPPRS